MKKNRGTMSKNKRYNFSWLIGIVGLIVISYSCSTNGSDPESSEYPNAPSFQNEYNDDMSEIDPRMLTAESDPCLRYGACGDLSEPDDSYFEDLYEEEQSSYTGNGSSCPTGCTSYISGCEIKGNISFESGEKIYHVPGQKYYSSTSIDPANGERWFCTEAEARANGWRKSYE